MSPLIPAHWSRQARVRRGVIVLAACLSLGVAGCAADATTRSTSSAALTTGRSSAAKAVSGVGGANTAEVVAAADAFLATLSDEQKDTVLYDFDDAAKKTGWSNFPIPVVTRNGLKLGDLTEAQDAAVMKLMAAALSKQGYKELVEIRKADDYLGSLPGAGNGRVHFGSEWYYISFFGEPSRTGQFTLQYGGHHAAYNITYAGRNVSISPTLTAVEPMEFDWEEMFYAPLADKRTGTIGAIQSLTETELAAAEIDGSFDDLLLGPRHDGPFPEPEGVLVSDLTRKQQAKVTAMLKAWIDDLDERAAARLLAKYVSEYDETYLGWSGGTTLDNTQTYVRLDGPSAWIEFSNQPGPETGGVHQHTIFRDETADYGWE
ncbi:DUF3500 domain-containing protein [Streptomyces sp. NPDC096132]|uniref:DUF3500 domain-containing protein n=1 Tax=Streptomyces sp. NPDC096132 TaxID=3366075 RepID=UPI00380C4D27